MFNFKSKLYQSIIDRDQQVKRYVARNGMEHRVHSAVAGYDNFEIQMDALGHSRAYRKIAAKADVLGQKQPEQFFYINYGARDLVEAPAIDSVQDQSNLHASFTSTLDILLKALTKVFNELPPPLKSSFIPDINLTARLLPTPTQTSA